ncbi:GNAT family N-acetyltransferase [Alteromonas sp. ASW11-36]|uniref:GNAT family N-acetyltransferase n=1 Tax=Alteromonas arenosi TaxID=3055817 RepID=A0ABT7T046_9ALTE|nr:GNAT family N-acetyltransferase [Alteromonas sp. ASW11-36]MDM7861818.1 GNAT family N-acetyltransferase [Alteromonas sp. ASW11-36]
MTHVDLNSIVVSRDDLSSSAIAEFLQQHIDDMRATSPPESKHALDLDGLRDPSIDFFSAVYLGQVVGCVALKRLSAQEAELKSMRTGSAVRGLGVGKLLLDFILTYAKSKGFLRVSLETGAMEFFAPARQLYQSRGFSLCGPFADYVDDPNSVFMTLSLEA